MVNYMANVIIPPCEFCFLIGSSQWHCISLLLGNWIISETAFASFCYGDGKMNVLNATFSYFALTLLEA